MASRSLDIMLSRPGIYVVITPVALTFVEVDADGCYQLTLDDYRRDGELRLGRWLIDRSRPSMPAREGA